MKLIKKIKVALGILSGKVLTGPVEVSVDLTRRCTMDCVMCWWWSPLIKERPSPEWVSQEIGFEAVKRLIRDFKSLKVETVVLGGQGEPFLYSHLFEAMELFKKAGIGVSLITSGFFLNQENTKALFDLGIDNLDVSLQAATHQTYLKVHPCQRQDTFGRIKEQLVLLSRLKKTHKKKIPTVRIIDVICNLNYEETVKVVELAAEVGAEYVGYKRLDVIPDTKALLLNNEQLEELKELIKEAKMKARELKVSTSIDFYEKYILSGITTGIYTCDYYTSVPCYVGWLSARILSDGSVIPCCGCYEVSFGNINNSSFVEIWHSPQYTEFRKKSINIWKHHSLVQSCKCYSCIDFEFNLGVYKKLHRFKNKNNLWMNILKK